MLPLNGAHLQVVVLRCNMVYCAQVQETLTKVKRIFGDGRPFLFSQLQQLIQQASLSLASPPSFT